MKKVSTSRNALTIIWITSIFALTFQLLDADSPELLLDVGETTVDLSWLTESDTYYFVQKSETLEAGSWLYHDFATKGDGLMKSTLLDASPSKQFFRLEFYDSSVNPLPTVLIANFDGDLADNKTELDQGTDVFGLTFSDADSLFDEWEFFFFGDLSQSDSGNDDGDFTANIEESQLELDPTVDERVSAVTYTYDLVGRLITASSDTLNLTYTLDEEGNVLSKN